MNDILKFLLLCAISPIIFLGFMFFTCKFLMDIANWEEEKARNISRNRYKR